MRKLQGFQLEDTSGRGSAHRQCSVARTWKRSFSSTQATPVGVEIMKTLLSKKIEM
ncbi:hypothetical protein U0070_000115 [Myodes glareolus]|uniref:Uncharacterized protein n=1 Tax=Myodes glareolus TaxID=447135 RepID=A0AAW0I004_MYOGA